jgi:aspartate/methionine/tyrosine aminotransferase
MCECIENSDCKGKIRYIYPQAAWYLFLNFDKYKGRLAEHNINSSVDLQMFLLNTYGIVTVAGKHFNVRGLNLRFSLVDIINFHGDICSRMKEGFGLLLDYFSHL